MTKPQPLTLTPTPEVSLPRTPLVRVLAQVRFPTILDIRDPDKVAGFQNALRKTYPNLIQDQVHSIRFGNGDVPDVHRNIIWRLTDQERQFGWRVSLGVDFVALDASAYRSRKDFLDRLLAVLAAVEESFKPASAIRLGLRYIDRMTGEAVDRIADLIHAEVLGIMQPTDTLNPSLKDSILHQLTEAQFLSLDGARIQARWGRLPENATVDPEALEPLKEPSWILDFDMFTTEPQPFAKGALLATAKDFAEYLYWVFRQMVTDEFLRFYGGEP